MTETIGILCGGRSGEHQVSLISALGVSQALDTQRYQPLLAAIDQDGQWRIGNAHSLLKNQQQTDSIHISPKAPACFPAPNNGRIRFLDAQTFQSLADIQIFFPLIHGTDGEDGTLQGWLNLANVPFVGADVAPSVLCIDKELTKKLLIQANLPCAPWLSFQRPQTPPTWQQVSQTLGADVFIKPAKLGSSVGVQHAQNSASYQQALEDALQYDDKILIEQTIIGRELECSVLGSPNSSIQKPQASILGEIQPQEDFYSYQAKYLDPQAAILHIPANLPTQLTQQAQALAIKAFETLQIQAMARIDFFLTPQNKWLINEINTIPGFTPISMYPKLWEKSGIPYPKLLHILIQLAKEYHQTKQSLQRSFSQNH